TDRICCIGKPGSFCHPSVNLTSPTKRVLKRRSNSSSTNEILSTQLRELSIAADESDCEYDASVRRWSSLFIIVSHRKIDTAPAEQVALPNGGAERRKEVRLSVSLPATIVPFHQNSRRALDATIIDFSAGGQLKSIVEVTTSETGASYIAEVRRVSVSE